MWPPRIAEGVLMGFQKRPELLVSIARVEGTATVAKREHKEVLLHAVVAEVHARLAQSIWLVSPGGVSNRVSARSACACTARSGATKRLTAS
jgi:hypothetical protein